MDLLYLVFFAIVAYLVRQVVLPPSNFPRNIPTIPFYVAFIPVLTNMDQEQIFNRYFRAKLEKYGAVNMYFASQWNVLITRPEYVTQVLRNNDVFEKSGNSEKIPHAVVLEYLGDNIISAGNEQWRKYRKVITNSLLFPNTQTLGTHLLELVSRISELLLKSSSVLVPGFLLRFFLASIGDCVIGCNLDAGVLARVRYLKGQIFRPFFMNFPDLDKLPIPSRQRARVAVKEFKALLRQKILDERTVENADRLGPQLAGAVKTGDLTNKQFEDNAIIALVAGHENPEILMTNVLYMLAKNQQVQRELRSQLASIGPDEKEDLAYLNAVIFESLRMYPPIGQLVNRITRQTICLGKDIVIAKGIYVGMNNFITQRDPRYWPDPDTFAPKRWGDTTMEVMKKYTLAKSRCELTAFHGRNRACLGEKFALMEVRKCVVAIVENFEFSLDPTWKEKLTPAGPIWPVQLSLNIKSLVK